MRWIEAKPEALQNPSTFSISAEMVKIWQGSPTEAGTLLPSTFIYVSWSTTDVLYLNFPLVIPLTVHLWAQICISSLLSTCLLPISSATLVVAYYKKKCTKTSILLFVCICPFVLHIFSSDDLLINLKRQFLSSGLLQTLLILIPFIVIFSGSGL